MLERNLWSRSAHIQRHSGREPHRHVFWHPRNDRRRTHLGRKSIVDTAVNKEEQVKKNKKQTTTWRCCWASSIWAADASTPAEFTVEPRGASDAMDLKVRCLLLLFTFHVQEGYTGNGEANPGSNRLFQVFFFPLNPSMFYTPTRTSLFFSFLDYLNSRFFPASTCLRHTFHFIIEFINYRMFWLPFTDLRLVRLFVYVKFAGYVVIYWHSNDLCAILAFRTRACNLCWPCVQ